MFGHNSSSGSIGTLTVLAAVALGTLLTPLDCAVVRAQPTDLALGLKNDTFALSLETGSDETAISPAARSSGHPAWVTDIESKTWPGFLTGLRWQVANGSADARQGGESGEFGPAARHGVSVRSQSS